VIADLLAPGGRGRLPLVRQTEAAECGLACLAMVAAFHGRRIDLNTLRRRHPVSLQGVTLRGLIQVAGQLGLACRPLRIEPQHLRQIRLPAILHWDMTHFVVLRAAGGRGLVVHDPAAGERRIPLAEASKHLTGVALELSPTDRFERRDERARLPFAAFWGHTRGLAHPLAQVLALSVVLQVLVLAAPFYVQLAVDEVIARGDADLLVVLALGFGLLAVATAAVTALRSQLILVVQNLLHFQIGARLFHHLLRLPLSWFEKRHVGDVLSRFGSIEPVRNLIAEGMIAAAVDGAMALATLGMILAYSPLLAGVGLAALALYTALRLALFPALRARSEEAIQTRARQNSSFIETVRAVQGLKLFNREGEREGQWLNRYAEEVSANVRLGRARIAFAALNDLVFGLENVVTVYVAARLALEGSLTVGMVFAVLGYKQSFLGKAVQLVEKGIDLRLLGLHLERLADIAANEPEPGHDRPLAYGRRLQGGIELREVSFRYAETERFVLERVSLAIEPGRYVAITGPSGGGKTTLVKIMLGLLEPTSGEVLVDGVPLPVIGPRAYREQVAAVMQEDHLLSGSIADNICFFDAGFDQDWMVECGRLAGVHDEIMAMPMAYNSLIGDMGSSLSGGQKQRVLLARALYRRPRILFLDEGTAHLDLERERRINEALRRLDITRVSVAHRAEMMSGADVVLRIGPAAG